MPRIAGLLPAPPSRSPDARPAGARASGAPVAAPEAIAPVRQAASPADEAVFAHPSAASDKAAGGGPDRSAGASDTTGFAARHQATDAPAPSLLAAAAATALYRAMDGLLQPARGPRLSARA